MTPKEKANKFIENIYEDTVYWTDLWDSLDAGELYSLMKSNSFKRTIRKDYKRYFVERTFREMLPLVGIVVSTHLILEVLNETNKHI